MAPDAALAGLEALIGRLKALRARGFEAALREFGEATLERSAREWPRAIWPALAESTLREKARLGFPSTPLVRTGAMQQAALGPDAMQVDGWSLEIGEAVTQVLSPKGYPYAYVQFYGSRKRPNHPPARPWVVMSEMDQTALRDAVAREIERAAEG